MFQENRCTMAFLELILIFVLQFKVCISVDPNIINKRDGHDAILPCGTASPSNTTCHSLYWLHNRDTAETFNVPVGRRIIMKGSGQAARLSVDTDCSLVIRNVTAEDAGLYSCRLESPTLQDARVYLSVLTISSSPPDAGPEGGGEVTLTCSLVRYSALGPCKQDSIRWVDESGALLLGEGVGYKFLRQMNCSSVLKVSQSGFSRKYTCQLLDEENKVLIDADYTPGGQEEQSNSDATNSLYYVMLALRISGLILMFGITVSIIRKRGKTKPVEDDNCVKNDANEVSYENIEARPAASSSDL